MIFETPEQIGSIIQQLRDAEILRAPNRALVNALYNGKPPYTAEEEKTNHIRVNVNWGEGSDLIAQARQQFENAHLATDPIFLISVPNAPKSKAVQIGNKLTRLVNDILMDNQPYLHTRREKWASVSVHGVGPTMWEDGWKWCPFFVGIDDLLIPTDTDLTLDGMNHFAVRRKMTPGQLFRKTWGLPKNKRDPAWNMPAIEKLLKKMRDVNQNQDEFNWSDNPEKVGELEKQNTTFWNSDAVPKIWMWDFYHQEDDKERPCWYRKIILDDDCVAAHSINPDGKTQFIYSSDEPFADAIGQILHIQFADGNNIAPFMYHSVRGPGLRLFDTIHMLNRFRCQFVQKCFQDLLDLFKVSDPSDRARLEQIYISLNYGVIPDGLNFVTRDQRYSMDPQLAEMAMSNFKQLLGEGSAQYTQDVDTGTNKERTAFEVNTLLQQNTKLTGCMDNLSYLQERFQYREICRRLTLKDTPDWEAKVFQNACKEEKIDERWVDARQWKIEPVRVLGSGNAQLELAQARGLMGVQPKFNPEGQQEVLHEFVFALTHDPARANRLAPLDRAPHVTDTVHDTELVFGTLMGGTPVTPKPGTNPIEAVETTLRLMGQLVQKVMQSGGVGTPPQVQGLQTAAQYAGAWIQQLAQDKENKQRVKQYGDALAQMMNMVKAMAQRQQEMAQKQQQGNGQMNPEAMAKLQAAQAAGEQKMKMAADKHMQRMQQTAQKFQQSQAMQHARTVADMHAKGVQTGLEAGRRPANPQEQE